MCQFISSNILARDAIARPIVELDCYDGYSIELNNDVDSWSTGKYVSIGVVPLTPCGDAPSFFVGPTLELKGLGSLLFEGLCWASEKDRSGLMLQHRDNYFFDYMLNNCNALTEYTPNCKGSYIRRLFVRKNFDGSKYVRWFMHEDINEKKI